MEDRRININPSPVSQADDQVIGTDTQYVPRVVLPQEKSYVPRVVSLGPFHSHKKYELDDFKKRNFPCKKLPERDDHLKRLAKKIIELHGQNIRDWYGPENCTGRGDEDLGSTMARDGLFLLQFLSNRKAARFISQIKPAFAVQEDIMKLENQIPLFVLKTVIEWEAETYQWIMTGRDPDRELNLILRHAWHKLSPFAYNEDLHALVQANPSSHLLGFVYENIISGFGWDSKDSACNIKENRLSRAKELDSGGLKFAGQKGHQQNKISFDRKTCMLSLPTIEMDDRTDAVMRNLLAFEDKKEKKPLRCYVQMMNRLIDQAEDVQLLKKKGIIKSDLGSDQEVATIWNGMTKNLEKSNYEPIDSVIDDVVTFCSSKYRILWAEFKQNYLSKPWLTVALIGGCISLLLSVAQTLLAWEQVRLQLQSMK